MKKVMLILMLAIVLGFVWGVVAAGGFHKQPEESLCEHVAIGGGERTLCDQDSHCRIEYDENGDFTVYECTIHAPTPLVIDATTPDLEIDTDSGFDPNLLIVDDTALWLTEMSDIAFCVGSVEVVFTWDDGKFDVVYDPNDLTGAANAFFVGMKPYLNAHIRDAAERLNERENK